MDLPSERSGNGTFMHESGDESNGSKGDSDESFESSDKEDEASSKDDEHESEADESNSAHNKGTVIENDTPVSTYQSELADTDIHVQEDKTVDPEDLFVSAFNGSEMTDLRVEELGLHTSQYNPHPVFELLQDTVRLQVA